MRKEQIEIGKKYVNGKITVKLIDITKVDEDEEERIVLDLLEAPDFMRRLLKFFTKEHEKDNPKLKEGLMGITERCFLTCFKPIKN